MRKLCDLHTHSVYSDGTYTPAQLVNEAAELGLSAIALTDHNTVAGLPEFLSAAAGRPIEAVPGVEFSTDYCGLDIHVVALYVMPEAFDRVTALMAEGDRRKEESNVALIRSLNRAGYALDYAAIRDATPNGHVNRAHIAAAMIRKGYASSLQDAFQNVLEPKCGFYVPPRRPDILSVIEFIHSLGAVSILAHPFLKLDEPALRTLLEQAVPRGLCGMETLYATFDAPTTRKAVEFAEQYGLLQSGGSDFHGENKPDLRLGCGRGNLAVPLDFLDKIRAAKEKSSRSLQESDN